MKMIIVYMNEMLRDIIALIIQLNMVHCVIIFGGVRVHSGANNVVVTRFNRRFL